MVRAGSHRGVLGAHGARRAASGHATARRGVSGAPGRQTGRQQRGLSGWAARRRRSGAAEVRGKWGVKGWGTMGMLAGCVQRLTPTLALTAMHGRWNPTCYSTQPCVTVHIPLPSPAAPPSLGALPHAAQRLASPIRRPCHPRCRHRARQRTPGARPQAVHRPLLGTAAPCAVARHHDWHRAVRNAARHCERSCGWRCGPRGRRCWSVTCSGGSCDR